MHPRLSRTVAAVLLAAGFGVLGLGGCSSATSGPAPLVAGQPGPGQELFASDSEASSALVMAAKAKDRGALDHIFGPAVQELVSGDKVEDENALDRFAQHATEHTELEKIDANTSVIDIGTDKWPFPIPLVKTAGGQWFFDTESGKQEILARRIGANELETIKVCRAYVEAQREYASVDRDGSGVLKYAQHFVSHHGKDGLYWEAAAGEPESPFGPLIAQAAEEGYLPGQGKRPQPFHGYIYHILTRQGANAPGGKYNYIINGNMIAGFALVASPAEYGSAGVMTFIISHQGKLFQKDLGPHTSDIAHQMKEYDPDGSWTLVKE